MGDVEDDPTDPSAIVGDPRRLAAVRKTGLLDTGPEDAFDRLPGDFDRAP